MLLSFIRLCIHLHNTVAKLVMRVMHGVNCVCFTQIVSIVSIMLWLCVGVIIVCRDLSCFRTSLNYSHKLQPWLSDHEVNWINTH